MIFFIYKLLTDTDGDGCDDCVDCVEKLRLPDSLVKTEEKVGRLNDLFLLFSSQASALLYSFKSSSTRAESSAADERAHSDARSFVRSLLALTFSSSCFLLGQLEGLYTS